MEIKDEDDHNLSRLKLLDDLNFSRIKLIEALGDKNKTYFHLVKLWFHMKLTKDQFDQKARKLLEEKHFHLHNIFFISLINKCQLFANESKLFKPDSKEVSIKKRRPRKKAKLERSTYDSPNIRDYIPESVQFPAKILTESPRYCAQEGFLPDKALIYGRLLLAAWDYELEGAEDTAANLIVSASKIFLKNIITSIIKSRKALNEKDGIIMGFTPNALNCLVANSSRIYDERKVFDDKITQENNVPKYFDTVEEKLRNEVLEEACSIEAKPKYKINSFDLYTTLKMFPDVIPSNTIYQINMHRIINKLYHKVDIEENDLNKLEA